MATMVGVIGCLAASLLVFSGYTKFKNNGSLALSLLSLGFRDTFVSSMIRVFPIVEFVVGVTSLSVILLNMGPPWLLFFTYAILAIFYLVFSISVEMLYLKGYDGDCGCFGSWIKLSANFAHVLFNMVMAIILIYGCVMWWRLI
jgi:hypothetical protein